MTECRFHPGVKSQKRTFSQARKTGPPGSTGSGFHPGVRPHLRRAPTRWRTLPFLRIGRGAARAPRGGKGVRWPRRREVPFLGVGTRFWLFGGAGSRIPARPPDGDPYRSISTRSCSALATGSPSTNRRNGTRTPRQGWPRYAWMRIGGPGTRTKCPG